MSYKNRTARRKFAVSALKAGFITDQEAKDLAFGAANQLPEWMKHIDRRVDVSDVWIECTDPENERGEICEALFTSANVTCYAAREGCFDLPGFELIGIAVRDECGTIYRDREWAMKMLGADAVWRIEENEMEVA